MQEKIRLRLPHRNPEFILNAVYDAISRDGSEILDYSNGNASSRIVNLLIRLHAHNIS